MNSKENPKHFYNGNPNVKRAGVEQKFTGDQLKEYIKCKDDVLYFLLNYVRIISLDEGLVAFDPYDYQVELVEIFKENRFSISLLARQMGKCFSGQTIIDTYRKPRLSSIKYFVLKTFFKKEYNDLYQSYDRSRDLK